MAEHTDTDFNKFRCRATGEIVEAWQWWSGKEWGERCRIESYGPGAWLVAPFARGQLSYNESDFRRVCEPIHPERKRLQEVADGGTEALKWEWEPGKSGELPPGRRKDLEAARAAQQNGDLELWGNTYYVKDREPAVKPEPARPDRARLQQFCDYINSMVGLNTESESALVHCALEMRDEVDCIVKVNGVWYVKDREPPCQDFGASCLDDMLGTVVVEDDPPPAEETICVKCARQGYEVEFGLWTIGTFRCEIPTEPRMDYVLGGMREPELPLCREKNTDGRCPDFVPRSD